MSEREQDQQPVVIEVEAEKVEGVVDLDDMVGIVRALQEEAVRPRGPLLDLRPDILFSRPDVVSDRDLGGRLVRPVGAAAQPSPEALERLDAVSRLAGELAEQLAELARLRRPEA